MKLKLFSFLKPAPKKGSGESAETANVSANDEPEGDDAAEGGESPEGDEEPEEEAPQDPAPDEAPTDEDASATIARQGAEIVELQNAYNALGAHVESMTAQVAALGADRSAEIEQAAGAQATNITASQGVPTEKVGGVASTAGADAPKTASEFYSAYNKISDPAKAGAYYNKYCSVLSK